MARSSRSQGPALTIYTGSLDAKIKAELQEIAASLGLAEDGKKADIIARIQGYLQRHPRTRENPSYTGIRLDYSNSTKPRHAASRSPGREDYAPDEDQQIPEKYEISPFPRASSTPPPLAGEDDQDVLRYLHQISDESMTAVSNPGTARDSRIDSPQPGTPFVDLVAVKKAINVFFSDITHIWWISVSLDLFNICLHEFSWGSVPLLSTQVHFVYPSAKLISDPYFIMVVVNWFLSTIALPIIVASVVSFQSERRLCRLPFQFDPLVASIIKVAATTYSFPAYEGKDTDVLGVQWRSISAGVVAALAFAEATTA